MTEAIATRESLLTKILHEISLAKRYQRRNAPHLDLYKSIQNIKSSSSGNTMSYDKEFNYV